MLYDTLRQKANYIYKKSLISLENTQGGMGTKSGSQGGMQIRKITLNFLLLNKKRRGWETSPAIESIKY